MKLGPLAVWRGGISHDMIGGGGYPDKAMLPPHLRKHGLGQENDGHTRSGCLDKVVLACNVQCQKCRNRALEHNLQHFSASFSSF